MIDRKSTGRISEDRRVFKRSRNEAELSQSQHISINERDASASIGEIQKGRYQSTELTSILKSLNLSDFNISEVTSVERIEVGDQTVIQLKTGDFVKIAMVEVRE